MGSPGGMEEEKTSSTETLDIRRLRLPPRKLSTEPTSLRSSSDSALEREDLTVLTPVKAFVRKSRIEMEEEGGGAA